MFLLIHPKKYQCDMCKQIIDKYWTINMDLYKAKHVDFKLCSLCATKIVHFIKENKNDSRTDD